MKKKIIIWFVVILLGGIVSGIATWFSGRIISRLYPEKFYSIPKNAVFTEKLPGMVYPGNLISLQADLTLPYGCELAKVVVIPTDGAVAAGEPVVDIKSHWDRQFIKINFALRFFRFGKFSGGSLNIEIITSDKKSSTCPIVIPEIVVADPAPRGNDLNVELATEEKIHTPDRGLRHKLIIGAIALLIIIAVIVVFAIYSIRKKRKKVTIEAMTLQELALLYHEIDTGKIDAPQLFVRLVDIMKNFLALRFNVVVFSSTTEELLAAVENHREIFSSDSRKFFCDFLHRADLVKFAGVNAEKSLLLSALEGAEKVVNISIAAGTGEESAK